MSAPDNRQEAAKAAQTAQKGEKNAQARQNGDQLRDLKNVCSILLTNLSCSEHP